VGFGSSGVGARGDDVNIHRITEVSASQAVATALFTLNAGRYLALVLLQSRLNSNANDTSGVLALVKWDTINGQNFQKIMEWTNARGADTFSALYNGSAPQLNVTTSATGSQCTTLWNGLVLAVGQRTA